jgi:hypothetical protein
MERKSIATVDVYDRDMTMDIWLILPYDRAWEKEIHMTGHGEKTCHILGMLADIPSIHWA